MQTAQPLQNTTALDDALYRCEEAVKQTPDNIALFCQMGRFFWESRRRDGFNLCLRQSVQILKKAIKNGAADAALAIETMIFNSLVMTEESEEHYTRCFEMWRDDMAALGRKLAPKDAPPKTLDATRVAFIVHNGVVLGHTEVMFNYLAGLQEHNSQGIKPRIYVLGDVQQNFLDRAKQVDVGVVYTGQSQAGFATKLLGMRERMKADGYGVAVWVCTPPGLIFAFAARLAPVQIAWSLKFHPISGAYIDGYITFGAPSEQQKVYGRQAWEICPVPLALDYTPPSPQAIAEFRLPYGDACILGTLAREEKIAAPEFLEAVADILEQNPNCVFVWTGKTQPVSITSYFEQRGVAGRCHFIGWVDTAVVSAALDVFLETFPFGCGIIPFQALKAKTPLLSYAAPQTTYGLEYMQGEEKYLPDETKPILAAKDKAEYVALAGRLIRESAFRRQVVENESTYFAEKLAEKQKAAQRFFELTQAIAKRTLKS